MCSLQYVRKKRAVLGKKDDIFTFSQIEKGTANILLSLFYHLCNITDIRNFFVSSSYLKYISPLYLLTVFSTLYIPIPCLFLSFFVVIRCPSFMLGELSQLFSISIKNKFLSLFEKNSIFSNFSLDFSVASIALSKRLDKIQQISVSSTNSNFMLFGEKLNHQ